MAPGDFMMLRIGTDFAFKVHVVALLYVLRLQSAAQMQLYLRRNWKELLGVFIISRYAKTMKYFSSSEEVDAKY